MQPDDVVIDITANKQAIRLIIQGLLEIDENTDATRVTAEDLVQAASENHFTLPKQISPFMMQILKAERRALNRGNFESNVEYAHALAERLTTWWRGTSEDGIPVQKFQADDFYFALDKFVFLQATYDLIAGKLHRLDPVIGDLGCQWRVPFVLDAQEDLIRALAAEFDCTAENLPVLINDIKTNYDEAIQQLSENVDFANLLHFELFCAEADINKGKKLKAFQAKYHAVFRRFFKQLKELAPLFHRAHKCSQLFFTEWNYKVFNPISAKDYVTCCKAISYRMRRRVDCFGLSSVPQVLNLPYTKSQLAGKYDMLAACSLSYMREVATKVCKFNNIGLQLAEQEESNPEVIYGNDGDEIIEIHELPYNEIYNYGDDADTLVASIHKVLQKTYRTSQGSTTYDTHLFFAPLRLIFMYQHAKRQPIIIDHRRLLCTSLDDNITYESETFQDATYELLGSDILYFEPVPGGGFAYVANPSPEQQAKVGMCVETFSITTADNVEYPEGSEAFASANWDTYSTALQTAPIVNLILMAAAIHPEMPSNTFVGEQKTSAQNNVAYDEAIAVYNACTPLVCNSPNAYLQSMSGESVPLTNCSTSEWSIVAEKDAAVQLLTLLNATNTEYRHMLPGREAGRRLATPMPFGAIHIYGCTYAVKVLEMQEMLENLDQAKLRQQGVNRLMESKYDTYRPY